MQPFGERHFAFRKSQQPDLQVFNNYPTERHCSARCSAPPHTTTDNLLADPARSDIPFNRSNVGTYKARMKCSLPMSCMPRYCPMYGSTSCAACLKCPRAQQGRALHGHAVFFRGEVDASARSEGRPYQRTMSRTLSTGTGPSSNIIFGLCYFNSTFALVLDCPLQDVVHDTTKQLSDLVATYKAEQEPAEQEVHSRAKRLEAHGAEGKRLDVYVRLLLRNRVSRFCSHLLGSTGSRARAGTSWGLKNAAEQLLYSSNDILASERESLLSFQRTA
eukprot:350940-Chlamydomonas_euryale.AAC.2